MSGFELAIAIFLIGGFIAQGLKRIFEADPPEVAVLTILGRKTGTILKEGWHFFPFYPFVAGFVSISIETIDLNLSTQTVRTPDEVESEIGGKISWVFDPSEKTAAKNFIEAGEKKGVNQKLESIWQGNIREWAINRVGGPQTYKELLGASEEATDLILKSMARNSIEEIPSKAPTSILFKYFNEPIPIKPSESEIIDWGKNWENLKTFLEKEQQTHPLPGGLSELKEKVKKRRECLRDVRRGKGKFKKSEWGIKIQLLNITEPKILGEMARIMEQEAKEKRQIDAEKRQSDGFRERSKEWQAEGRSQEEADEKVLILAGKITKTVNEQKFSTTPEAKKTLIEVAKNFKPINILLGKENK